MKELAQGADSLKSFYLSEQQKCPYGKIPIHKHMNPWNLCQCKTCAARVKCIKNCLQFIFFKKHEVLLWRLFGDNYIFCIILDPFDKLAINFAIFLGKLISANTIFVYKERKKLVWQKKILDQGPQPSSEPEVYLQEMDLRGGKTKGGYLCM